MKPPLHHKPRPSTVAANSMRHAPKTAVLLALLAADADALAFLALSQPKAHAGLIGGAR